jgi:hypothetical protein
MDMFYDDMWISTSPNAHVVSVHCTWQMEHSLITEHDALYMWISNSPNAHIVLVHFTWQVECSLITKHDALYIWISSSPNVHVVCFTLLVKWNIISWLNTMLSMKPLVSIGMKLQNCSRRSWSLSVRACTHCRLFGLKWSHLHNTRHNVFWDIPNSWLARLVDFLGLYWKSHILISLFLLMDLVAQVFLVYTNTLCSQMFNTTALLFCL